VLWLNPLGNAAQMHESRQRVQILQKNKTFLPRLAVVQVGTRVEFPNEDPFFHNVFSLFEGKRFDLGLYEAESSRAVVINREGISYVFCNIHPEMSAVVVALKTPYYGIANRNGEIVIPNVPAGRYRMKVWHEKVLPETLNGFARTIVVSHEATSFGVLRLPEERNLSRGRKNKYGHEYDITSPNSIYVRP
ncbi:MAG: hypothetical protein HY646_12040, partial [Acidobacteria bacterium]|nr:hypothetical protein [Acidobacteriota bacterium]